jgi:zinc transport system substrate-binding protein
MNKITLAIIIFVLIVIGFGLFLLNTPAPVNRPDQLTIATTIFPLTDIARHIVGDQARIIQLLPSGASPHSYAPTPSQLLDLQNISVLFVIGHGLDDWAASTASKVTSAPVVTTDQNITLRSFKDDSSDTSIDPHYWLTVPNAQIMAATIAATLQDIDPDHHQQYQANLAAYSQQLANLETKLQLQVSQSNTRKFIAMHDSWSYLADHYNLELITTYEPIEGKQPSIQDINNLQRLVKQHSLTSFFTEPQKESIAASRFLETELNLSIKTIDPIGGTGQNDSYLNLIQNNINAITSNPS